MGRGHTPEEFGGASGVRGADGGVAAAAGRRVMNSCINRQLPSPDPSLGSAPTSAASPAPPQTASTASEERSVPVRAALLALRFYKAYLSILFAGSCRFQPTCSRYAYEAIERFGVRRGIWLGLKRLLCCQPLSRKFGYDPVPEKWEKMPTSSNAGKAFETEAHS